VILVNAGECELITAGQGEVQPQPRALLAGQRGWKSPPAGTTGLKPPIDKMSSMSRGRKGIDKLGADFIAAGADAWSDGDVYVGGSGAEFAYQRLDRGGNGTARHSPPPRVNRGDRARPAVGKQQRHTVGRADGHCGCGIVRHQHIAGRPPFGQRHSPPDRNDLAAVHLMRGHDLFSAYGSSHPFPVVSSRQRHAARCEQMRGQSVEGAAPQREPAW
jgi:hypothetical protein